MSSWYCNRAIRLAMGGRYLQLHAMICCKKERNYPDTWKNTLHDNAVLPVLILSFGKLGRVVCGRRPGSGRHTLELDSHNALPDCVHLPLSLLVICASGGYLYCRFKHSN
ncbi:MAG: hypothetical protein WB870_12370 [Gallionellaceae bacterium]